MDRRLRPPRKRAVRRIPANPPSPLDIAARRRLAVGLVVSILGLGLLFEWFLIRPLFSELQYSFFSSAGSGSTSGHVTDREERLPVGRDNQPSENPAPTRRYNQTTSVEDFDWIGGRVQTEPTRSYNQATSVEVTDFRATLDGRRIRLEWRAAQEINILGFHLYRQVNGQRVRLTDKIIGAKSLEAAGGPAVGGYNYEYMDTPPPRSRPTYFLEVVTLDNSKRLHGPISVNSQPDLGVYR